MNSTRAVFFDRDGTLMEEVHYCADPAQVKLYPGVPDALRNLKEAGFRTFVITNQSGIGRGLITEAQYRAVEAELLRQIGEGLLIIFTTEDMPFGRESFGSLGSLKSLLAYLRRWCIIVV